MPEFVAADLAILDDLGKEFTPDRLTVMEWSPGKRIIADHPGPHYAP